jgi:hypothetical protein
MFVEIVLLVVVLCFDRFWLIQAWLSSDPDTYHQKQSIYHQKWRSYHGFWMRKRQLYEMCRIMELFWIPRQHYLLPFVFRRLCFGLGPGFKPRLPFLGACS